MAHFAFVDEQNVVTEVIVGNDASDAHDWEAYYAEVRGQRCLRTSYNTHGGTHSAGGEPFRGNYAGVGYSYLPDLDIFMPPSPGEGWVVDAATATWVPG